MDNTSIWQKIEIYNDPSGIVIDAKISDNANDQGDIIARIFANADGEPAVVYFDHRIKTDSYGLAALKKAKTLIKKI